MTGSSLRLHCTNSGTDPRGRKAVRASAALRFSRLRCPRPALCGRCRPGSVKRLKENPDELCGNRHR